MKLIPRDALAYAKIDKRHALNVAMKKLRIKFISRIKPRRKGK